MNFAPKISIITVVYNAEALIEKTVLSVIHQTFKSIEFIIIDGASTDNTLTIAKKYEQHIKSIISEKDNGIYDAMNKGLKKASGEYVLFLNAGDELFSNDTLENIFKKNINADIFYGNTAIINSQGKIIADRRLSPPASLNWKSLKYGMCVSHQSFIAKRLLCDFYNTEYKIAADIDWVINTLKQAEIVVNTNNYISKFLEGGTSNKRRKKALFERFKIMQKHYGILQTLWSHFVILLRFPIHKLFKKNMT
jgi:glycosyltransferase involved in cell wall biosynthesis